MANTDLLNLCELFQILNDVGHKGSLLESPAPHTVPVTPRSASPWQQLRWKHRGETKGKPPIQKYQTDLNTSELEIFWSSPPACQGTVKSCKGHGEHKTHTPWKTVDSWEPAHQDMQENITAKCKIFSKSCQLTGRILYLMVISWNIFFLTVAATIWWGKRTMNVFLKEQVTKVILVDVATYKIWSNNSHLSFPQKKNQITCNCKI